MEEIIFLIIFIIIGLILLGLLDEIHTGSGNAEYRKWAYIMTCISIIIFLSMFAILIYNLYHK